MKELLFSRKIMLSIGSVVFMGALAVGATGAFFSDTEVSHANTFTAGAVDLKVDSQSHYAGLKCTPSTSPAGYQWVVEDQAVGTTRPDLVGQSCDGSWTATELGPTNHFFNISDVKPGDPGEDTVSLHIDNNGKNNPAWACANIAVTGNAENGTTSPEVAAGDSATLNGPFDGELAQNIQFVIWRDDASTSPVVAGDNIHQATEKILYTGPLVSGPITGTTSVTLPLADSTTGTGPLNPGTDGYIGMAWCAGTISVSPTTGAISCDGSSMGNQTQTDGMTADVTLNVTQFRNQPNFKCVAPIGVGSNDLSTNGGADGKWFFYNDQAGSPDGAEGVNNTLGSFVTGPLVPFVGAGSAEITVAAQPTCTLTSPDTCLRRDLATFQFAGVPLSSISQMSFGSYSHSGASSATEAPFLNLGVDFTGVSTAWQKRIAFVPSANGSVVQNTWQQWDAIQGGNSKWSYSGTTWPNTTVGPDANVPTPGTTLRTWSQILADYPNIRIHPTIPFVGLRVGEPNPQGFTADIDFFTINTGTGSKTFDFGN